MPQPWPANGWPTTTYTLVKTPVGQLTATHRDRHTWTDFGNDMIYSNFYCRQVVITRLSTNMLQKPSCLRLKLSPVTCHYNCPLRLSINNQQPVCLSGSFAVHIVLMAQHLFSVLNSACKIGRDWHRNRSSFALRAKTTDYWYTASKCRPDATRLSTTISSWHDLLNSPLLNSTVLQYCTQL